ncbi:MAG: sigma-70 family RNA polymerase sigma factor, partial [Myxococcota bacterium]
MARRTLYRLLGPIDDIEDLEQTVLCRLLESLGRFRGDADLGSFVRGICVHVARDHLRRKKVRSVVQPVADVERLSSTREGERHADVTMGQRQSGMRLRECLETL